VRPILDMRRDGAPRCARLRRRSRGPGAQYKGAYSGEHGDGLCRGEWVAWQYGPRLNEAFSEIKALFDPTTVLQSGQDRATAEDGRRAQCSASRRAIAYRLSDHRPRLVGMERRPIR
jgi:hypothetical protein